MTNWAENKELPTGYFRLWLLLKVYKFFGRRVLKIVIFPIILFSFFFMKAIRKASKEYFYTLYQYTKDKRLKPSLKNTFKHLYSFAESLLDKVAAWAGDIKNASLIYEDKEATTEFIKTSKAKNGMFILSSHLGNVEVLRALALDEFKDTVMNVFMDTARTQSFNSFLEKTNPDSKLNLWSTSDINMETAFLTKDRLDNGEVFVMSADRVSASNRKDVVERIFIGKQAKFPIGAFKFAKMMEVDLCFLAICYGSNKQYHVYLNYYKYEQKMKLDDIINNYAGWLENLTIQHPYQWYNFYKFWND